MASLARWTHPACLNPVQANETPAPSDGLGEMEGCGGEVGT